MALPDPAIACSHADLVRKLTTENITSLITICEKEKKYIYIYIYVYLQIGNFIILFVEPRIPEYRQMECLESCHVSKISIRKFQSTLENPKFLRILPRSIRLTRKNNDRGIIIIILVDEVEVSSETIGG